VLVPGPVIKPALPATMRRTPRAKETDLPGASKDRSRNQMHDTSAIIKFSGRSEGRPKVGAFSREIQLSVMLVAL
jgi:hypothetical protein